MPKHLHVACAVISRDGLILAGRRKPGLNMAGKWEFPGGKIKDGESPADCLRRELREELGIEVEILSALPCHTHHYGAPVLESGVRGLDRALFGGRLDARIPEADAASSRGEEKRGQARALHTGPFTVTLYPFLCRLSPSPAGPPPELSSTDHDALAWLPARRLPELDWAEADLPILAELK